MTLPVRQSRRYGPVAAGALLATRSSVEGIALEVRDDGVDLALRPAVADRRHRGAAVPEDGLELLRVRRQRIADERRADEALRLRAVALGAAGGELLLAERDRRERGLVLDPRRVVRLREHLHGLGHLRVKVAAELRALALEDTEGDARVRRDLEPGVVRLARDRVRLRPERRDPPRVRDVRGVDVEQHEPVLRDDHLVEGERAV